MTSDPSPAAHPGTTVVPRSGLPMRFARFYTAVRRRGGGFRHPLWPQNGKNAMLKEYHYDDLVRWPRGERAAVFLIFDFQGGEDVKPDKNGILNYESWSQGEYGSHQVIYRLLRILKDENIKATFLTCGAIAERFPEAVQAILDHGHVVEGHGYNHEIARYLPRDQEDQVMKNAISMIQKRTGRRCYGWGPCPQ